VADADLLDRERGLRSGHEGVAAQFHRGGAGVRGLAREDRQMALHAERAEHRGRGLAAALQHRSLLDVQLQIRAGAAQLGVRLVRAIQLHPVARDHVLEPLAVAVAQVAHLVDVERPGAGRGAEQAAAEAGALLVGPVDQAQAHGRAAGLRLRAQRLHRGELAERAVQPAAGRHRVDVRADDHEPVRLAGQVGPEVAGGVDAHVDRQLGEARAQELAGAHPLVGPAHPAGPVGAAGEVGELAQVREDAVCPHQVATGAGAPSERGTKRPWPGWVRISPRS
jgi:hypothetical protein